ncbi:MAG: tetratricopeptide repeat protein, partial [Desulfosudaceae bacterium]
CLEIFGSCDQQHIQAISAANPEIQDISRIKPGQMIRFPHTARAQAADYTEKTIDLYQSILADYPEEYRASLELALYYQQIGRPEEAGRILAELGEKSKRDSRIIQYVNQLYIETKKYDQAHLLVHGMRRGAPDSSALHYLAGSLYDREDRKEKAIKHFTSVAEDSSFYRHALLQAALLYEDTGQMKEADDLFKTLLAEEPDNAGLLLYAGAFYERRQDYDRAIELYRHGLEIEPDDPELHYRLGVAYDQTGDKDRVIEHLKKSLEIKPDDASTLNYLGYTYADRGIRLDEARELIEKALELDPDNGYIIDSLGWVYFKKGDLDKAVQYLEKAVRLAPDDPILLEHLGDAYAGQNQPEKALDCYRRSLEHSDDENKPALQKKINDIRQETDTP